MSSMNDVREATQKLAKMHYENDPDTKVILSFPNSDKIRLIEVTGSVGSTGEVFSIEFGPDAGNLIPFDSEIILISPEEWKMIQEKRLSLPTPWNIDLLEPIQRAS